MFMLNRKLLRLDSNLFLYTIYRKSCQYFLKTGFLGGRGFLFQDTLIQKFKKRKHWKIFCQNLVTYNIYELPTFLLKFS